MKNINLDHAIEIYKSIKDKHDVTNDLGQLYFAIAMLGDEVTRLQKELASESTRVFIREKK